MTDVSELINVSFVMDCWLTDQTEFTFDGNRSCKEQVENCPLVSNTQALERLDLVGLSFSHDVRKSYSMSSEPSVEIYNDENNVASSFCHEKETHLRNPTKFGQPNTPNLSLIDLKLGGLSNSGGVEVGEFLSASVPSSSNVSSILVKRSRPTILNSLAPCCQVLGCNKDLSYSKGYYKRHKVCELHTKTAKVVVDGIEQRFCQQCSRFHLVSEFDDVKRSCRRRLAVHNKRRRKPQFGSESGSKLIGFSSPCGFSQLFHDTLFDSGDETSNFIQDVKDNTNDIQRLYGIQQTSSALSLLSSKSHSHSHTISSHLLGASDTDPSKSDYVLELHATETSRIETSTTSQCDGISRIPYLGHDDTDSHNPLGRGIVLDLLQLSSHLQRVEQQRRSSESEAG